MQLQGPALYQHRLKGLNTQPMQGGSAVQKHRMPLDDHFQGVPNLWLRPLHRFSGGLDIADGAGFHQALHDKGLEQLQSHFLRQAALVHFQLRAYHDNGTAGIVHALAQQVLAETPLLTLQHIGKGFQRTIVGAGYRPAPAAVIDQSVNRFLKHALFIADDDVRGAQLQQPFQAVVPVDDSSVKVVQVRGGESAAVQLNHRTDIRGNDRHHVQDHPLRAVAGKPEAFHDLQALQQADPLLPGGGSKLFLQLVGEGIQVDFLQELFNGFRAHAGLEIVLIFFPHIPVFFFIQELLLGQLSGGAGVGDDVHGKVQHLFQHPGRDIQNQAHPGGDPLKIPDMGNRRGQLDVAHTLSSHLGAGNLYAAAVADFTLIADPFILAAMALPVLGRSENALAEQAVPLGLQGSVIDGFRLLYLAVGPLSNFIRRGQSDFN